MSTMTTAGLPKVANAAMSTIFWDITQKQSKSAEYKQVFDIEKSNVGRIEDVELIGPGIAPVKAEGSAMQLDRIRQGSPQYFNQVAYGLQLSVTRELIDDAKDGHSTPLTNFLTKSAEYLAHSHMQTREYRAAGLFNEGFDANFSRADGVPLFSDSHPTVAGGLQSNITIAADLSEASLENMIQGVLNAKDQRGNIVSLQPKKLIVGNANIHRAARILNSANQSGTANNDINAIRVMGHVQELVRMSRLTNQNSWYLTTDAPRGLMFYERIAPQIQEVDNRYNETVDIVSYQRFVVACASFLAVFGNTGV